MRRSLATLAVAAVASMCVTTQAHAQTIVTNPLQLVAGGRDDHKPPPREKNGCAAPTLICAGKNAADLVGDAAAAGAGAATDSVMSGVVSWAADGAAWIVSAIGTRIDRSTGPALDSPWYAPIYRAPSRIVEALDDQIATRIRSCRARTRALA